MSTAGEQWAVRCVRGRALFLDRARLRGRWASRGGTGCCRRWASRTWATSTSRRKSRVCRGSIPRARVAACSSLSWCVCARAPRRVVGDRARQCFDGQAPVPLAAGAVCSELDSAWEVVGCVALRRLDGMSNVRPSDGAAHTFPRAGCAAAVSEVKRLYVRPAFRGRNIGTTVRVVCSSSS